MKSLIINDVDATASIHEYLSEFVSTNLRRHHQSQVTRVINPGRVIRSTPHNGLLRPSQVMGNCRLNSVHSPLVELLVSLAQTCGKNVILRNIQLLWMTLISRLLLLLTPLARLLIITTLITMIITTLITLVALEAGIRTATSITRAMRTVAA